MCRASNPFGGGGGSNPFASKGSTDPFATASNRATLTSQPKPPSPAGYRPFDENGSERVVNPTRGASRVHALLTHCGTGVARQQ